MQWCIHDQATSCLITFNHQETEIPLHSTFLNTILLLRYISQNETALKRICATCFLNVHLGFSVVWWNCHNARTTKQQQQQQNKTTGNIHIHRLVFFISKEEMNQKATFCKHFAAILQRLEAVKRCY